MAGRLLATGLGEVDVPTLLAELDRAEVRMYAITPDDATLEDVYFALHDGRDDEPENDTAGRQDGSRNEE
jgi:hypothetical protein